MSAAQILEALPRLSPMEFETVDRRMCELKSRLKPAGPQPDMDEWARELAELRRRVGTGKTGVPLQQIMDEIRGDR